MEPEIVVHPNSYLFRYSKEIKELNTSVFEDKIKNFHYYRFFKSGYFYGLVTHMDVVQYHFSKRYILLPYFPADIKTHDYMFILSPDLENGFSQVVADYRSLFNIYYPLYLYERHENYFDLFVYQYSGNPINAFDYYFSKMELFQKFKSIFKINAATLIKKTATHKIDIPDQLKPNESHFLKSNQASIIHRSRERLTNRENECVQYLLKNMSAKEIAFNLGISFRTVETHLENIKIKMNARNKFELISKLKE